MPSVYDRFSLVSDFQLAGDQARAIGPWTREVTAERVGFAARNYYQIALSRGHRFAAREAHLAVSFGHEMIDDDVLSLRHVLDAYFHARWLSYAPRGGELGVEKHGARKTHQPQHVG